MRSVINLKLNTRVKKRNIFNLFKKASKVKPVLFLVFPIVVNSASAVEIIQVSENATIIGKVFNDVNNNGIQDINEHGIPGVRLATVTGLLLETDGYGRYHIPDNAINTRHARNFILKVYDASLPIGSIIQSENPRIVRLTNGSLNKINFAVKY